ncbi:hypothetical protein EZS27_023956 [termite gut metagenome]|uniref:Uncharacterized protein n=1 Tax=termite gut metagenome TaxID=433724 RepID=A0A5J4QYI2_9ZZZZ
MAERFYSITHLSTERLRELYSSYRKHGWVDGDYYDLIPDGVTPPELPDEEILFNIDAGNEHNYFVFMAHHEDEEDGVMIGFGLSDYPSFAVYLHLPPEMLDELIEKYSLHDFKEAKNYTGREFLIEEKSKGSQN